MIRIWFLSCSIYIELFITVYESLQLLRFFAAAVQFDQYEFETFRNSYCTRARDFASSPM